jgi:hypothetical protein
MTLYRGTVVDMVAGRPVVNIPRLHGSPGHRDVGPLPALITGRAGDEVEPGAQPLLVPGLQIGDAVLVADELDGRVDQYVVLGRLLP